MSTNNPPEYDYLIAGAGIAGLYTAYHLNKHFPSARICILEASAYIGGRLHTIAGGIYLVKVSSDDGKVAYQFKMIKL